MVFVQIQDILNLTRKPKNPVDHGIGSSSKGRKHVVGGEGDHLHPSWIASKSKTKSSRTVPSKSSRVDKWLSLILTKKACWYCLVSDWCAKQSLLVYDVMCCFHKELPLRSVYSLVLRPCFSCASASRQMFHYISSLFSFAKPPSVCRLPCTTMTLLVQHTSLVARQ